MFYLYTNPESKEGVGGGKGHGLKLTYLLPGETEVHLEDVFMAFVGIPGLRRFVGRCVEYGALGLISRLQPVSKPLDAAKSFTRSLQHRVTLAERSQMK